MMRAIGNSWKFPLANAPKEAICQIFFLENLAEYGVILL